MKAKFKVGDKVRIRTKDISYVDFKIDRRKGYKIADTSRKCIALYVSLEKIWFRKKDIVHYVKTGRRKKKEQAPAAVGAPIPVGYTDVIKAISIMEAWIEHCEKLRIEVEQLRSFKGETIAVIKSYE